MKYRCIFQHFHPDFQLNDREATLNDREATLNDREATPIKTLLRAYEIAQDAGIKHV